MYTDLEALCRTSGQSLTHSRNQGFEQHFRCSDTFSPTVPLLKVAPTHTLTQYKDEVYDEDDDDEDDDDDDDEVGGCHLSHLENGRQEEGVRKNGWPGSGCKWIFIR